MAEANVDKLARDLVRLLTGLAGLYGELAMHMHNKLDAMKRADAEQISSITAREMVLADKAGQREGLRRQIVSRMLERLGVSPPADRPMRLTELAEHLPEPRRSQLLVAATGLREQLRGIERMRVTTKLVTGEMLKHIGEVMLVMTSGVGGGDVYERTGARQSSKSPHVFEAVG